MLKILVLNIDVNHLSWYWSRLDKQSTDLQPVVDQQAINNITVNADQYKDNWVDCY